MIYKNRFHLGACTLLGWIALETSFSESLRSLKMEFRVKSYGVFREVTCAVFQSCGSAANFHSSAAPRQRRVLERQRHTCTCHNG
jgi:hypothetical protein